MPAGWFSNLSCVLNSSSDSLLGVICSSSSVCVCVSIFLAASGQMCACFPIALCRCGPQQGHKVNIATATINLHKAN